MSYDPVGNMTKEYTSNNIGEEAAKREVDYTYDSRNRLSYTKNKNDDGSYVYNEVYYDKAGNQKDTYIGSTAAGAKNGNHTSYTYDQLNRVTKVTDPMGYEEKYTLYDGNHNPLTKIDKKGKTIRTQYTALNQPKLVTVDGSQERVGYTYYKTGLLSSVTASDKTNKAESNTY